MKRGVREGGEWWLVRKWRIGHPYVKLCYQYKRNIRKGVYIAIFFAYYSKCGCIDSLLLWKFNNRISIGLCKSENIYSVHIMVVPAYFISKDDWCFWKKNVWSRLSYFAYLNYSVYSNNPILKLWQMINLRTNSIELSYN